MLRRTVLQAGLCAALSLTALSAHAFTAGTDFVELEKPLPGGEGKLVKIWSYDCPFCYKYDAGVDPKMVPAMEKASGLHFEMMHLETKGKYGRVASELFAYCRLEDEKAGRSLEAKDSLFKKAKDAVYTAYHRKGERWAAGEEAFLKTGLTAAGIAPEVFAEGRKDPAVQALADSWKPSYDVAKIQGIPAYVVNGKYLVMTKSIRSIDGLVQLVTELSKK